MPELPEVETLCRQLQTRIAGKKILSTKVCDHKLDGIGNVRGLRVLGVCRRGKTVEMRLEGGQCIIIHLRMSGRLFWRTGRCRESHTRWRITLEGGGIDLVDPRRFATVRVISDPPEALTNDLMGSFDFRKFLQSQAGRRVPVKTLLMDPKAIAGIGNIYACEILHASGISPLRPAAALDETEWKKIFRQARRILRRAIAGRGTSISDWRDLDGCPGENQKPLKVYGREGEACVRCGGIIVRIRQSGRSTYCCPRCQKE